MGEKAETLIARAEAFMASRQFADAARCLEEAIRLREGTVERTALYLRAADAYSEAQYTAAAARCYRVAAQLLRGERKAECLLGCWTLYVDAIVGYQYDRSWELSQEVAGHRDAGTDVYESLIEECEKAAQEVLTEALHIDGVDPSRLLEEAKAYAASKEGWLRGADVLGDRLRRSGGE